MTDIAVIDIIVSPPALIEVVTGTKGDPGPPGPPGAPGSATLPTAPLGQVLSSQGVGVSPVFRQDLLLLNPTALGAGASWRVSVEASGDLLIRLHDAAGAPQGPHVGIDPYQGGFYTAYGGFGALNGTVQVKWLTLDPHVYAEVNAVARGSVGNLATISDSTTNTPGAVIAGGGSFSVLARWNGTAWIVIGG